MLLLFDLHTGRIPICMGVVIGVLDVLIRRCISRILQGTRIGLFNIFGYLHRLEQSFSLL